MMARQRDPAANDQKLRFEEALECLEEVVRDLEGGELSLEDSLQRFERGVRLVSLCSERLKAARLRVSKLEEGPDGPVSRPLEGEDEEQE